MKIIFPDYHNSLVNITNSILKYYDVKSFHNSLAELDEILNEKDYQNIVLMLYDGMGSNIMDKNLPLNSFFRSNKIKDINAVFPPTTTASTTSVLTGLYPNEHGWLGWDLYFKDIDKTVTMFKNTIKDTNEVAASFSLAHKYYPYNSIIELIASKVKAVSLYPFGENGYSDLNNMFTRIEELCKTNEKTFIYAYHDEPDYSMHEFGTKNIKIKELFKRIDSGTKKLCETLKNTLVIVIADHGHIDSEGITLSEYKDFIATLKRDISIEGRACNFFVKENQKEIFENLFQKYFGEYFKLYKKEEVINKKLFGIGVNHAKFSDALGDYLAVATKNKYFRFKENSINFKSMHAGITEDEVLVPLIVYKCMNKDINVN